MVSMVAFPADALFTQKRNKFHGFNKKQPKKQYAQFQGSRSFECVSLNVRYFKTDDCFLNLGARYLLWSSFI
mgnify:CR=1 FL=1